jgi:hypothetical protein
VNRINPGHMNTNVTAEIGDLQGDSGKIVAARLDRQRVELVLERAHGITGETVRVAGGAHRLGY